MSASPSPRPWRVGVSYQSHSHPYRGWCAVVHCARDMQVTITYGETREEAIANADLICRAVNGYDQMRQALVEWQTRYRQILEATNKLCHEIRFASNKDELWRMVGYSQAVEELHTRVLYELDQVDAALQPLPDPPQETR